MEGNRDEKNGGNDDRPCRSSAVDSAWHMADKEEKGEKIAAFYGE